MQILGGTKALVDWYESWQLKFDNVSKVFNNKVIAVDNVNFFVKKGEFLTILGPSGSGKTTILRMIAGFEFPTSGEILLYNKPLTFVPPNKRSVNTVFQNYALFPHMNVYNNITFGLAAKKVPHDVIKSKVSEILELVSLSGLEKRYPDQLSGGQQQRVALARALVCRPEILLSDESLGALDLKLRRQTQIALKQIHDTTNITFIHVTHDQEEAFIMSDRIIVINDGKIEQIGSPFDLYCNPQSLFVGGFIGENNLLKIKIDNINNKVIKGISTRQDNIIISKNESFPKEIHLGETLYIFIRPESIVIDSPEELANKLPVEVKGVFLYGSEIKILFKYSDAENILLKLQTDASNLKKVQRGEKVMIGFNPEDVIGVFKEPKT